jgi:hypothetical protein
MCDMVTVGGKDNVLETGYHCVYRRTDRWTDNPIQVYPPYFRCWGMIIVTISFPEYAAGISIDF